MNIHISPTWRINAEHTIEVPLSASAVWGQVRDLEHFLTLDPLHARIDCVPPADGQWKGVSMRISHRLLGIGPDRVGRVLVWNEGSEVVFSDLSTRGVDRGFPHVCGLQIEPLTPSRCRLRFSARGKWTARWIPHWCIKAWITWVLAATGMRVSAELRAIRTPPVTAGRAHG